MRQLKLRAKPAPSPTPFMLLTRGVLTALAYSAVAVSGTGLGVLRLPFDAARAQYQQAVHAGLIERSILASRDFERALGAIEQLSLGPLARSV